ncbi:unnamed protein product, partial [Closterium sp. NIES-53]
VLPTLLVMAKVDERTIRAVEMYCTWHREAWNQTYHTDEMLANLEEIACTLVPMLIDKFEVDEQASKFYIPKIHAMLHVSDDIRRRDVPIHYYTDVYEHVHVAVIKRPYRASNKRNAEAMITRRCLTSELVEMMSATDETADDQARSVALQQVSAASSKRVLRYLCSTSGMRLVLGGRARVVLTGHVDASWVDDLATQRSSSCEAEIYARAMAAQELRWLTYLLTDMGVVPRSPPVLYVDNKAMVALCQEHRLEHRMKNIALRYFLARELQQRGQLRLAYMATRANTADIFTKALQPCDHQRFCTMLGLVPTWSHLLTS